MDDLINRQAAIDAIENIDPSVAWLDYAANVIKALPSAQPEPIIVNIDHELTQEEYEKLRKDMANAPIMLLPSAERKGHWIGIDDYPYESWECDQCGCIYEEMPSWTPNFCPNCGADMRGEQNDT